MSMFSQTTEYALRAIVWLAAHGSEPQTTHQIAAATHVPSGYLSKVLQSLGRAGLVHSQRGLYGGFALVRDAATIRVIDVVTAVDPIRRIHSCPLELKTHGTELSAMHRRLDDAMAHIEHAFSESTVADLLAEPAGSRPLCDGTEAS
jgi:Rrf2 family nitric oxide-sensitive transcriptional repressor